MKQLLFCGILLQFSFWVAAQSIRTPVSSAYLRLTTYSSAQHDVFSFNGNPGALAAEKNFSAGIYGEKRYLLDELSFYSAAAAIKTGSGNFGLKADYTGSGAYNESVIGLSYARKLTEKLDVGVQFNYNSFRIAGYGQDGVVNFDAGAILHLTDQLQAGLHVYNPTGVKFGKANEEKLPAIYALGFGYDVSEKFFLGAEIEKVEDQPVNVNAGVQYNFDEKFFARSGIQSSGSAFYLGLGFRVKEFRIDATASVHPQLGFTPGLLLLYSVPH